MQYSRSNVFCSAIGCNSLSRRDRHKGISFHTYPKQGTTVNKNGEIMDLRRIWEIKLRCGKEASKSMVACSLHFQTKDFKPNLKGKGIRRCLFSTAIPSQRLAVSWSLDMEPGAERNEELMIEESVDFSCTVPTLYAETQLNRSPMSTCTMDPHLRCSVPECQTRGNQCLQFYPFPFFDWEICSIWLERINGRDSIESIDPLEAKVCELHFDYRCKTGKDSSLDGNSLPTINLPKCEDQFNDLKCFHMGADKMMQPYLEISSDELPQYCRFCFSKGFLYHIQSSTYRSKSFLSLINSPPDDIPVNPPPNACLSCLKSILIANWLPKAVKHSNKVLKALQNAKHSKVALNKCKLSFDIKSELASCKLVQASSVSTSDIDENTVVKDEDDPVFNTNEDLGKDCFQFEEIQIIGENAYMSDSNQSDHDISNSPTLPNQDTFVDNPEYLFEDDRDSDGVIVNEISFDDEIIITDDSENSCASDEDSDDDQQSSTGISIERTYKCDLCQFSTDYEVNLPLHKKNHTEGSRHFECKKCNKGFLRRYFVRHNATVHADEFICSVCDQPNGSAEDLAVHYATHQLFQCNICSKVVKRLSQTAHMLTHRRVAKLCTLCGKLIKHRHICSAVPMKTFSCTHCSFNTKFRASLQRHMDLHKPDGRRFLCTNCGQGFQQKISLTNHAKQHLELENAKKCLLCPKEFKTNYEFQLHKKCHFRTKSMREDKYWNNEDLVFECPTCEWKSPSQKSFVKHLRTHGADGALEVYESSIAPEVTNVERDDSPTPEEDRFKCNECQKSFKSKMNLTIHIRNHGEYRPFHCSQCPSTFQFHTQLRTHLINTHEDGEHECPTCGKVFKSEMYLKSHLQSHTERKLKCKHCERTYKSRVSMLRHMRDAHKISSRKKRKS